MTFPASIEPDALVVGMTLVPGFLSRNRSFALFEDPMVRRAKRRAALLRGIVRQLAGAVGAVEGLEVVAETGARELRYRVPGIGVDRRAMLTDVEYSCVAYLAGRARVAGLRADPEDRARIDAALKRLAQGLRLPEIQEGPL
jgi:hypothetical protein